MVEDFGETAITVTKVKAHASQRMVDDGAIDEIDKFGNDLADDAAKKGAAMHPSFEEIAAKIKVSRHVAGEVVRWLGVGLEAAQRCGAMPAELTAAQKRERPPLRPLKRLEVTPDDVWRAERLHEHFTCDVHSSHSLCKVGKYYFCSVCGCHGSQKLVALAEPCTKVATPSRRYLLKRLLAGSHPRTGEHLGEVVRAERGEASHLTASSRRRSHSA